MQTPFQGTYNKCIVTLENPFVEEMNTVYFQHTSAQTLEWSLTAQEENGI